MECKWTIDGALTMIAVHLSSTILECKYAFRDRIVVKENNLSSTILECKLIPSLPVISSDKVFK